jgi:copper homeostasis protein
MPLFEICTDSVDGVRAAVSAGAARVELCASLIEGGVTPSIGMVRQAVAAADRRLGVHVIIRPRGGDFLYGEDEFAVMRWDVEAMKPAGADGVVIGLLDAEGAIEETRAAALIAAARPLSVTFHRAFDVSRDPFASLDALIRLGGRSAVDLRAGAQRAGRGAPDPSTDRPRGGPHCHHAGRRHYLAQRLPHRGRDRR